MSLLPVGFPGFPLDLGVRGHPHPAQILEMRAPAGTRKQHVILFGQTPEGAGSFPDTVLAVHDGRVSWISGNPYPWGAFTLAVPDGTIAGGNERGNGALDLQFVRRQLATEVASGNEAVLLGNGGHTASGNNSVCCGGGEYGQARGNTTSGACSFNGSGRSNSVSALDAGNVAGFGNAVSGEAAFTGAGNYAAASLYCQYGHAAGRFASTGDAQRSDLVARRSITGTTIAQLYLNGSTLKADLGGSNRLWACELTLAASVNTVGNGTAPLAVGNSFVGKRYFAVKRVTNDAGTALVGAVETLGTDKADANMAGAAITITADTTDGSAKIEFAPCTLAGSTTITRVVAHLQLTELGI